MPSYARTHQLRDSLIYHVVNRGNFRGRIFHDEEDFNRFKEILISYTQDYNLRVYHWVLMSNHYHLCLELANPELLSSIMAGIARSYVHYHHKKYNTNGHLWQDRFKAQPIQKERYLLACGRYIERNPVRVKVVNQPEGYIFSSAAYYIQNKDDGLTIDDPLYLIFGDELSSRKLAYKKFLGDFDKKEEELFRNFQSPQGSKEFISCLKKEKGLLVPRRRGRIRRI